MQLPTFGQSLYMACSSNFTLFFFFLIVKKIIKNFYFYFISNIISLKSAKGHNPSARKVYKSVLNQRKQKEHEFKNSANVTHLITYWEPSFELWEFTRIWSMTQLVL
jgi:hypothetical protein